ncbi:hypothetical protein KC219_28485, partial [Mycobacterium tuberculosis]|nr:hypothetical protein [Mycobacterium tuberculosis]
MLYKQKGIRNPFFMHVVGKGSVILVLSAVSPQRVKELRALNTIPFPISQQFGWIIFDDPQFEV